MATTTKQGKGFSWADEVEREEQQEMEKRAEPEPKGKIGKIDPFGAARPREIVLRDKGVDWRDLDQRFDSHLNLRMDEKKEKGSMITLPTRKQENFPKTLHNQEKGVHETAARYMAPHQPITTEFISPSRCLPLMQRIHDGRHEMPTAGFSKNHLARHPFELNETPVRHLDSVPPAHIFEKSVHFNTGMAMYNVEGIRTRDKVEPNGKRKLLWESYNYSPGDDLAGRIIHSGYNYTDNSKYCFDEFKEGTRRRENYDRKCRPHTEDLEHNRRRIFGELHDNRSIIRENCIDELYHQEYMEERNGMRKYGIGTHTTYTASGPYITSYSQMNYYSENRCFDANVLNARSLRSSSVGTQFGGKEIYGQSATKMTRETGISRARRSDMLLGNCAKPTQSISKKGKLSSTPSGIVQSQRKRKK